MAFGIIVCGLNGSGKSTLGAALAQELGLPFLDAEQLYFPNARPDAGYAAPRPREQACAELARWTQEHPRFVFASVKGGFGAQIEADRKIRMQRVYDRSLRRFGARMLPGGDLYESERAFLARAAARDERLVEDWLRALPCPVLRVNGELPIAHNAAQLARRIKEMEEWIC